MDESVLAALARWPQVPSVYGWLSLDRRGGWRLRGDPVRHAGLAAFISRNYARTEHGEWFFQNGPQRVFAALDYTPWVLRWSEEPGLTCHTGHPATNPASAWLDEDGNLLIGFDGGVGLVCDQDLPALMAQFSDAPAAGTADAVAAIEHFLADGAGHPLWLHLDAGPLPVGTIRAAEVATRFAFNPAPASRDAQPRP